MLRDAFRVRLSLPPLRTGPMSFWFGDFELDQERRQLLRSGEPVSLEPKAYELLSLLLERRPRALSRAQIRDAIWPQTFVSESTLAVVVNGIRQALEDDARHPRFIRTVHAFGYAFCGEAHQTADERSGTGDAHPEAGGGPARGELGISAARAGARCPCRAVTGRAGRGEVGGTRAVGRRRYRSPRRPVRRVVLVRRTPHHVTR